MAEEDMSAIRAAKSKLRQSIQVSLQKLQPADVSAQTSKAHAVLFSLPEYQRAKTISVYLSMPSGEISTEAVVRSALRAGKDVLVPYLYKILNAGKPKTVMDMVSLHSEVDYDALTPDKWGIPSVNPDSVSQRRRCLVVDNDDIDDDRGVALQTPLDVVIVPGVAFDQRLQRVGHGKGFYDSFFSSYRARLQSQAVESIHMPYLVALALEQQVLPSQAEVPVTASDWPVDSLVVGSGEVLRWAD